MKALLTVAAIALCLIGTVAGLFIGWVPAWLYSWFLGSLLGAGNLFDWIGIGIINDVVLVWFPLLVQGAIGGAIGLLVTKRLLTQANLTVVTYVCTVVVVLLTGVWIFGLADHSLDTVSPLASSAGTIGAYFAVLNA